MAKRAITAEDLLKIVFLGDPQISPDGAKIAFARKTVNTDKNKYETHVWVADAKTGEARQYTSGQESEGNARWSPDGKHLAFVAAREKPKSQIYLLPTYGGEARKLTDMEEGGIGGIRWSPDGKRIGFVFTPTAPERTEKAGKEREEKGLSSPPRIFTEAHYRLDGHGYYDGQFGQIHVVDVATGKVKKLTDEKFGVGGFCWAPDSKQICFAVNRTPDPTMTPQYDDLIVLNADAGKERKLAGLPDGPKGGPEWSRDGKSILYVGDPHIDDWWVARNLRLYVADAKGGSHKDLFGEKHDYSMAVGVLGDTREGGFESSYAWSPDSKTIYFNVGWHGSVQLASIPAAGGKITFLTDGPGAFEIGNMDAAGTKFAMSVGTSLSPGEIAVSELKRGKLEIRQLTHENKALLSELELSKPESFWIDSADKTKVHGWLMQPHGYKAGKKYPCVLEIHGGPHAQYGETFFHEFQVLAAQGYVVVFSNPRGSKGYGEAHCRAISGDWGNTDTIDVMAVADHAASLPFVDKKKMGAMGGSYGGYMTNWLIGHTNRFKAAITDRSVVSLLSFAGTCDFPFVPDTEWRGNPWDNIDHLWQQSPLKYMGNCKTPTMIIHSEGDLRCNIEQADQLFSALKRLGVEVKYVRYPANTSHGLSRMGPPDMRLHRLGEIVEWWKDHFGRK